ncbi:AbrB/MazE/SpoVT family DNA-binding domain-containing protein [uncultured Sphingomonas sp.]|uniref:AbrB/MazE/SpoVT family DNA-binding domain-containing protein n=1 Tax=uncultured Sphingomonas sp. TaxID=158754 RepID=UPI0025D2487B|nr:AbrB/MazE/SpoVT family DNA-binding domain-containing protein [uncultured Sphingomonas sp.]
MNKLSSPKAATEVRVIKIGNSQGVILPKDVLAQLGVAQGDTVDVIAKDGGVFLRKQDIGFADQMAAAREVMRKRRDALRELAK